MKRQIGSLLALCLMAASGVTGSTTASAQGPTGEITQPPKVLVIMREFLKPGRGGSMHQKSEQAFVQAMSDAKSPDHYLAANSLSGKSRALFFLGYDSFAEWGSDMESMMKNATLAAAFDSAQAEDGKLLSGYDTGVFVYQPKMSVSPGINLGQMRYIEITALKVRMGHDDDWEALVKMHNEMYAKLPHAQMDVFEKRFGAESGNMYIAITGMHSLAELDQRRAAAHAAYSHLSADQKKKMDELDGAALESVESNLFAIDPKMSYAADSWRASDPGFWGQK